MVNAFRFTKRETKIPIDLYRIVGIAMICLLFLAASIPSSLFPNDYHSNESEARRDVDDSRSIRENEINAQRIKHIRQQILQQCSNSSNATMVDEWNRMVTTDYIQTFTLPTSESISKARRTTTIHRCKNVIMDFGANIGDTLGHVIDAGMMIPNELCDPYRTTTLSGATATSGQNYIHFNVETKQFDIVNRLNKLTSHLHQLVTTTNKDNTNENVSGPEDYCYYGIEGNPVFTERLQKLEAFVMSIQPRPIQQVHFFTESVGTGEDGMTKLYLDTINSKHNFWGSSIYKDHQDVRKSVDGKDAESTAVPVMGYTIGTLMRMALQAFDPKASDSNKVGGHFILKVDIEGGEYPLLHQAIENGTLCEFVTMGGKADIFIEFHSAKVTGRHEYVGKTREMKDKLLGCGVTMGNLGANWH